jgi:hypothetical protein
VLDRLRDLRGDREEELDLVVAEHARLARADVQRPLEPHPPRENRHRQDRLVLVLRQVREVLEARIQVRLLRQHHRGAGGRRRSRDPLTWTHARPAGQLVHVRPVRRAQHELVQATVVEVDETGVGLQRVGDVRRDQREDLLEVERRVDGLNRLGQQPQVPVACIHPGQSVRSRP